MGRLGGREEGEVLLWQEQAKRELEECRTITPYLHKFFINEELEDLWGELKPVIEQKYLES